MGVLTHGEICGSVCGTTDGLGYHMVVDTAVLFGWCRRKAAGGGRWVVGH